MTASDGHSAARPKMSGKTVLFAKRQAVQKLLEGLLQAVASIRPALLLSVWRGENKADAAHSRQ